MGSSLCARQRGGLGRQHGQRPRLHTVWRPGHLGRRGQRGVRPNNYDQQSGSGSTRFHASHRHDQHPAGHHNFVSWVDDSLPKGAQAGADGGDSWNWVSSNPTPFSGSVASQSSIGAGEHQHFFSYATATLPVNTGDTLAASVDLDPANPPTEIMLQGFSADGSWDHRAYWGANSLAYGRDGSVARQYMGALPATGQWVPLYVPASRVGLEGSTLTGMAFTLFTGRATWDAAGKGTYIQSTNNPITSTNGPGTNTTATTNLMLTNFVSWVDDSLPAGAQTGADGGDSWNWVSSNPTPFSGQVANQSSIGAGEHQHFFSYATATLPVNSGDTIAAYVYLDPTNPPTEVMLQWYANDWEHRAYWGANSLTYGTDGTASRHSMGALPATGQWVPLFVPASQVGLEGSFTERHGLHPIRRPRHLGRRGQGTLIHHGDFHQPTAARHGGTNSNSPITGAQIRRPHYQCGSPTVMSAVDDTTLRDAATGRQWPCTSCRPICLELVMINTKQPDPARGDTMELREFGLAVHGARALGVCGDRQRQGRSRCRPSVSNAARSLRPSSLTICASRTHSVSAIGQQHCRPTKLSSCKTPTARSGRPACNSRTRRIRCDSIPPSM